MLRRASALVETLLRSCSTPETKEQMLVHFRSAPKKYLLSDDCPSFYSQSSVSLYDNSPPHWAHYRIKEGLHENADLSVIEPSTQLANCSLTRNVLFWARQRLTNKTPQTIWISGCSRRRTVFRCLLSLRNTDHKCCAQERWKYMGAELERPLLARGRSCKTALI